jgi:3-methyladenine DNA glycosylase AlkC
MAEPFKNLFTPAVVVALGEQLAAAGPFDAEAFTAAAVDGLDERELKDRVRHTAAVLRDHLDPDFEVALAHVLRSLPPAAAGENAVGPGIGQWVLCQLVEAYGVEHPAVSIPALRELTQRFTCEFAVRPYLDRYPDVALPYLHEWSADPDEHVRRLASEGSRPRLPWGQRLQGFVADPGPVLELLEGMRDDPSEMVRRSVANNLNDIAKDHPDRVGEVAARWLEGASKERKTLVKHALRSLIKQGHPGALEALGYGEPRVELAGFEVTPALVELGTGIEIRLEMVSTHGEAQPLIVDFAIHHRKANGGLTAKVFKWSTRTLKAGGTLAMVKRHAIRPISTRRYYAGEHRVEILVNGRSLGLRSFELVVPVDGS